MRKEYTISLNESLHKVLVESMKNLVEDSNDFKSVEKVTDATKTLNGDFFIPYSSLTESEFDCLTKSIEYGFKENIIDNREYLKLRMIF